MNAYKRPSRPTQWKPLVEREDELGFERFDPETYVAAGCQSPVRLRVEYDEDSANVVIEEAGVTSTSPRAHVCGMSAVIELNEDETIWLFEALAKLIDRQGWGKGEGFK